MRTEETIERAAESRLSAHLSAQDRAEAREDALETLAAEIYDREIGEALSFRLIEEATGEILAGLDTDEKAELEAAYAAGRYGEWLQPQVEEYWSAYCIEQARQQLDKLDREAEEDHYRDQVAA